MNASDSWADAADPRPPNDVGAGDAPMVGDEPVSVEVPHEMLQPQTLRAVIEEFVTRDGTNLAEMDQSVAQVMRQLQSGRVKLWFDPQNNNCTIRRVEDRA